MNASEKKRNLAVSQCNCDLRRTKLFNENNKANCGYEAAQQGTAEDCIEEAETK